MPLLHTTARHKEVLHLGESPADIPAMSNLSTPEIGGRFVDSTSDHGARWRMVAACGLLAVMGATGYYLSSGPIKGRLWESTIISLLALMAIGIVRFHRGAPMAWIAIWAGLASAFLGGFLAAHPTLAPFDVTSPSPVDAMRLANYPLGATGVLNLLFRTDQRVGRRALLEVAIAVSAGSVLIWTLVVDPLLADTTASGGPLVVALLYPFADILLLGVLAVLIVHLNGAPGSLMLVALALAGNLVADIAFSYKALHGGYEPGGLIDVGWLLCFASLALAPSWPTSSLGQPVGDGGRLNAGRLLFLTAGALLAPGLALAQALTGSPPGADLLLASVTLIGLVVVRLAIFNRDLDASRTEVVQLADQLGDSNRQLTQAQANQRRLLDRLHRVVEEERTRIAADLHDRPLQHLAGIGYQLEWVNLLLARGDSEAASDVCDQAAAQLADQLHELRILMTDIRPPVLDERGLVGALSDRGAQIQTDHPGLTVQVAGCNDRVDHVVETALFRAAQEALQNVIRHADASAVSVDVSCDGDQVVLTISDDGRGIDQVSRTELLKSGRFGLAGMGERVELLGGSMTIVGESPKGTTIRFRVPSVPTSTTAEIDSLTESLRLTPAAAGVIR